MHGGCGHECACGAVVLAALHRSEGSSSNGHGGHGRELGSDRRLTSAPDEQQRKGQREMRGVRGGWGEMEEGWEEESSTSAR